MIERFLFSLGKEDEEGGLNRCISMAIEAAGGHKVQDQRPM